MTHLHSDNKSNKSGKSRVHLNPKPHHRNSREFQSSHDFQEYHYPAQPQFQSLHTIWPETAPAPVSRKPPTRNSNSKFLMQNKLIITTYQTLAFREIASEVLYRIIWKFQLQNSEESEYEEWRFWKFIHVYLNSPECQKITIIHIYMDLMIKPFMKTFRFVWRKKPKHIN